MRIIRKTLNRQVLPVGLAACLAVTLSHPLTGQTAQFSGAQSTLSTSGIESPFGVAVDASRNVYIADSSKNQVLKETISSGTYTQSVVAASSTGSSLSFPTGVAVDSSGNVYIADNSNARVLKETPSGSGGYTQTTVAGPTTGSSIASPMGIAVDGSGNVYVADNANNAVYKETYANGTYTEDAFASAAGNGLAGPMDVAVDGSGDVYIADTANNRVLEEVPQTVGTYTQSVLSTYGIASPYAVAVDASGNVFIDDYGNQRVVKETLQAGTYTQSTVGLAFTQPKGLAVDTAEDIFVGDAGTGLTTEITQAGNVGWANVTSTSTNSAALVFNFVTAGTIGKPAVLTLGQPGLDFADLGTGTCTANGVAYAYSAGDACTVNVSFAPTRTGTRIGAAQLLTNAGSVIAEGYVYGTGQGPQINFWPGTPMATTGLQGVAGVTVDAVGNIYSTLTGGTLVKVTAAGSGVTTLASGFSTPGQVAIDGNGNLYVADTGNNRVVLESLSNGAYTQTVIPSSTLSRPTGVAVDPAGNVYIADTGNDRVLKETPSGGTYVETTVASESLCGLGSANMLAADGAGNVYIVDATNQRVVMESPSGSSYAQTTVASYLNGPTGISVDGNGNVYIAISSNNTVLKEIPQASGTFAQVTVPIAHGATPFSGLAGVTADGSGNIYIADSGNNRIVEEDFADAPALTFAPTTIGTTTSPQTVTLLNNGNAPLAQETPASGGNPYISSSAFVLDPSSTCQQLSSLSAEASLSPEASCAVSIDFEPTMEGSTTGTLDFTDNNLNAAAPNYATQAIDLTGTATQADITAISLTANPTTVSSTLNQPVTFTATITDTTTPGTVPTGTVTFTDSVNGPLGSAEIGSNGIATLTVGISGVATHTITATYGGVTGRFAPISSTVPLMVTKGDAAITWATPAAITFGTPLSAQLNATSNIPGSFTYSPAVGSLLPAGTQTLTATFTPTDLTDYAITTESVQLTVNQAKPAITWPVAAGISYGTPLSATQLDATASVPGSFVYSPPAGTVLTAGTQNLVATFIPTDVNDYATVMATVTIVVTPTFTVAAATTTASTVTAAQGVPATFALTMTPMSETTYPHAITLSVTGTPPGSTATFSPSTIPAGSGTVPVTLTVTTQATQGAASQAWVNGPKSNSSEAPVALAFLLLPLMGMKRFRKRMPLLMLAAALSMGAVVGLSGCGSTPMGGSQTYNMVVTATDSVTQAQATTNLTLTVQQ